MRKKLTLYTLALLGIVVLFNACKKEYETIQATDEAKIEAFAKQSNLTFTKDPQGTGFRYSITNAGTGDLYKNTDSVLYDIKVTALNGAQYIQSPVNGNLASYVGYTNSFYYLNSLIYNSTSANARLLTGLDIPAIRSVLLKLAPGGTATVVLPSYLAFKKNGTKTIPANEVVLLNITTYPKRKQWELDDSKISAFLAAKGITNAIKDPSRVYYQVLTQGTGTETIDRYSTLVVKYTGRLLDGTVFDSSTSFTTTTGSVILGWGKILPKFTAGTKLRLFIPSDLAYSTAGSINQTTGDAVIPANAVLDFDIEIVSVTN